MSDTEIGLRVLQLRRMREANGWSLRRVAGFIGVSPSILSLVERGRYPCYPRWRERLELLFKLSSAELLAADTQETEAK